MLPLPLVLFGLFLGMTLGMPTLLTSERTPRRSLSLPTSTYVIPRRALTSPPRLGMSLYDRDTVYPNQPPRPSTLLRNWVRQSVTKEYKALRPELIKNLPFMMRFMNKMLLRILQRGEALNASPNPSITPEERGVLTSWLGVSSRGKLHKALELTEKSIYKELDAFTNEAIECKVQRLLGMVDSLLTGGTRKGFLPPVPVDLSKEAKMDYYSNHILPEVMEVFHRYGKDKLPQVSERLILGFLQVFAEDSPTALALSRRAAHAFALALESPVSISWKCFTRHVEKESLARMRVWLELEQEGDRSLVEGGGIKEKPIEIFFLDHSLF